MKRFLIVLLLGCANVLTAQTPPDSDTPHFQPAQVISVTYVAISTPCLAVGTVVLDALVTEEGKPQDVEVRRDIACLTDPAVNAVKEWKFSPAKVGEKTVASRIAVAVTFCPAGAMADPLSVGSLRPQTDAAIQAEFQPAEVLHGKYPIYPMDATAFGAVVLEVSLSANAEVGDVTVAQDLPPFTSHAREVVGDWRFMPATDNGHAVPSSVVLAFVFPPLTPPNN